MRVCCNARERRVATAITGTTPPQSRHSTESGSFPVPRFFEAMCSPWAPPEAWAFFSVLAKQSTHRKRAPYCKFRTPPQSIVRIPYRERHTASDWLSLLPHDARMASSMTDRRCQDNDFPPRVGIPWRLASEEVADNRPKIDSYLRAVERTGGEPVLV